MNKYKIDVYIVDDHTMLNEGLTDALNRSETIRISRSFTNLDECRSVMQERRPDVLLLDISIPNGDSAAFCKWAVSEYPKIKIIALTIHDEYSVIQRMMDSGVHGYLLKSLPVGELIKAIQCVWHGGRFVCSEVEDIIRKAQTESVALTPVEKNILRLICDGLTNPQIAPQLGLSIETVNWYRKRLLSKFGVRNTVGLVTKALRERLV